MVVAGSSRYPGWGSQLRKTGLWLKWTWHRRKGCWIEIPRPPSSVVGSRTSEGLGDRAAQRRMIEPDAVERHAERAHNVVFAAPADIAGFRQTRPRTQTRERDRSTSGRDRGAARSMTPRRSFGRGDHARRSNAQSRCGRRFRFPAATPVRIEGGVSDEIGEVELARFAFDAHAAVVPRVWRPHVATTRLQEDKRFRLYDIAEVDAIVDSSTRTPVSIAIVEFGLTTEVTNSSPRLVPEPETTLPAGDSDRRAIVGEERARRLSSSCSELRRLHRSLSSCADSR